MSSGLVPSKASHLVSEFAQRNCTDDEEITGQFEVWQNPRFLAIGIGVLTVGMVLLFV